MTATQKQELIAFLSYKPRRKEEICFLFGISDRARRKWNAKLAKDLPVIALSSQEETRIATSEKDIKDAIHQIKENQSRADKILERNKGLEKFIAKAAELHQCSQTELERRYS